MAPQVAVVRFLALVALDGVARAGLGIDGVTKLDEYGPPLPASPLPASANRHQAPSGMAGSMDRPATRATNIPGRRVRPPVDLDPRAVVVLDALRIPEHTGDGFKRNERRAGDMAFRRRRPNDPEWVDDRARAKSSDLAGLVRPQPSVGFGTHPVRDHALKR